MLNELEMRSLYFILLLQLSFISSSVYSETILLKNKETIKGKIVTQNINSIKIEINGRIGEIPKDKIFKIVFHDLNKVEEEKIRKEEERKIEKEIHPATKEEIQEDNNAITEEENQTPVQEKSSVVENSVIPEKETIKTEPIQNLNIPSRRRVTTFSAILPGWGQYTEKRNFAAIVYPVLFICTGLLAYTSNKYYKNSLSDYNTLTRSTLASQIINKEQGNNSQDIVYSTYLINSQKSTVTNHHALTQNIGYALIGIYLLNLFDTYFFYNEGLFTQNKISSFYINYQAEVTSGQTQISQNYTKLNQVYAIGYTFQF